MVFNGEGCATIVLLYAYTESEERKKEGGKEKKCSPDLAGFELASLDCDE